MAGRSARSVRTTGRQTRRELLAAATGGLGVLAAEIALPGTAQAARQAPAAPAAQGAAVIEGEDNTGAAARTAVFTTGNKEFGILADPNSSGHGSIGVYGGGQDAGLRGEALSVGGLGVIGVGNGEGGVGVFATGGGGARGNGVTGMADGTGQSGAAGVEGFNTGTAPGVRGTGAIGVQAGGAIALQVIGPAQFLRSGKATIKHPASSVTVTVPDGLSAESLALALAQTQLAGLYVTSAVPDPATGTLRIHLNKSPGTSSRPASVTVAWFIVN
jgi:hypothetical protein